MEFIDTITRLFARTFGFHLSDVLTEVFAVFLVLFAKHQFNRILTDCYSLPANSQFHHHPSVVWINTLNLKGSRDNVLSAKKQPTDTRTRQYSEALGLTVLGFLHPFSAEGKRNSSMWIVETLPCHRGLCVHRTAPARSHQGPSPAPPLWLAPRPAWGDAGVCWAPGPLTQSDQLQGPSLSAGSGARLASRLCGTTVNR